MLIRTLTWILLLLLLLCIEKYTSLEAIKSTKPLDPQPFSLRIQKILTKSRNITP